MLGQAVSCLLRPLRKTRIVPGLGQSNMGKIGALNSPGPQSYSNVHTGHHQAEYCLHTHHRTSKKKWVKRRRDPIAGAPSLSLRRDIPAPPSISATDLSMNHRDFQTPASDPEPVTPPTYRVRPDDVREEPRIAACRVLSTMIPRSYRTVPSDSLCPRLTQARFHNPCASVFSL